MAARIAVPTTAQLPANPKTSFLDLAPPHWAARGLAWALITVFVLGALASVAITMPEKVTAQFVLVPVRGADPVKAMRGGVVLKLESSARRTDFQEGERKLKETNPNQRDSRGRTASRSGQYRRQSGAALRPARERS